MSGLGIEIAALIIAIVSAWLLPALGMRMLAPSLEASSWTATNYRGRRVYVGLGIVWVFWALGLAFAWLAMSLLGVDGESTPRATPLLLVLFAFIFGTVDDVFGSHGEKGFRGHLRAMAEGRLTTGGLKLVGIGAASLWAAYAVSMTSGRAAEWSRPQEAVGIVAGTVLVAGSANLLNLLDLRPGRALKGYLLLFALAWGSGVALAEWQGDAAASFASVLAVAVWFVGPVLAVWRYDLSERGMLGDAGANAAGVLVGYALLTSLPLWGVVAGAAVVTVLNVASERVSFSAVIEGNRVLARLDRLGRLPMDASTVQPPSDASE